MRRPTSAAIPLLVLAMPVASGAEPGTRPAYSSDKPLYAKVVLDEGGSKVLALAFDESQGPGRGYDAILPTSISTVTSPITS